MTQDNSLADLIIEGIRERKGRKITDINLSEIETAAAQHFIIAQGQSTTQVEAIADSVREYVEKHSGVRPYNYDGYRSARWIVIDYGDVMVHIFLPDEREHYNLEELWADAMISDLPDLD